MDESGKIDLRRYWITVYFLPQESMIPYRVVQPFFATQKEIREQTDPLENPTLHQESFQFRTEKNGTIYAATYCPIHGLSQSRASIEVT